MKQYLGIEFGSTRIKAVAVDDRLAPVQSGDYTWESTLHNGIWSYALEEAIAGMKAALRPIQDRESIASVGISGMMHGYLAFDQNWNLLTPFRTWRNTITGEAAAALSAALDINIPQRWSIAHLYQALLNKEPHTAQVAHITTLAGWIHFLLTGENVLGVGEASGVFPIDSAGGQYDPQRLAIADKLCKAQGARFDLIDLLPRVLPAGAEAGRLSAQGAALLEHMLPEGIPFAPPEGDAGTGMVATNAVAARTGNVSAGTSIFAMVVLEKPLSKLYEEIDMVCTPSGKPVAMVHCINCSSDANAWVALFGEVAQLFGAAPDKGELFRKLYEHSLQGDSDCGGVLLCNYLAGEHISHMENGVPLVARRQNASFSLANFFRAQLYSSIATLKIGMEILEQEQVAIDSLTGHGGLFKTPGVAQQYLADACNTKINVMETAGEGGPYGMALLAAYLLKKSPSESLEDFLNRYVFASAKISALAPDPKGRAGLLRYMEGFKQLLRVERSAVDALCD